MKKEPIRWRGLDFPSHKEAATHIGCCSATITKYLNMGRLDDLEPSAPGNKIPIIYEGVTYPSRADLARHIGISKRGLFLRLAKTGSPELNKRSKKCE